MLRFRARKYRFLLTALLVCGTVGATEPSSQNLSGCLAVISGDTVTLNCPSTPRAATTDPITAGNEQLKRLAATGIEVDGSTVTLRTAKSEIESLLSSPPDTLGREGGNYSEEQMSLIRGYWIAGPVIFPMPSPAHGEPARDRAEQKP